ncbi:OmpA family protein [Massilia sp. Dwa41.01b]|uniref:OmpA family protein n=1 Tax=unclassified Massilia TaxID=2609279 RepID=UPI001602CFD2|nr:MULTISPECIES: OmpA family protein [unclassified Massilia]QNA88047.1 OmpA family protein [Massilia sp. Dwa41.01b]QNA98953.1 OmpA family protein [Massilia sp. Se16.2.3]
MQINRTFGALWRIHSGRIARAGMLGVAALALGMASAAELRDIPGASDSPVVSRYQGSILDAAGGEPLGFTRVVDLEKGKPVLRQVEGRITNRFYFGPKGAAALEVLRNYRQALEAAGFQVVYACEEPQCVKDKVQKLVQELPKEARGIGSNVMARSMFNSGYQPGFNLVSARKAAGSGHVYVQVAMSIDSGSGKTAGRVQQLVQVVEPATAQTGKVTVDAKAIGDILKRDGKIALYGVNFDTNKAVLRPDSDEQLKQMAEALKAAPNLKVFIVGHTDNQGDFENNLGLSQRRAQAVAEALSTRYGIAANRMTARGVANLAPVASNEADDSRARNRRVELVLR